MTGPETRPAEPTAEQRLQADHLSEQLVRLDLDIVRGMVRTAIADLRDQHSEAVDMLRKAADLIDGAREALAPLTGEVAG